MLSGKAEASVLLTNPNGLHARPAVKVTKLAKTFRANLEITAAGLPGWIDAKSIVKVMALMVPRDTMLTIRAEGEDAKVAVAALAALVERHFDEGSADNEGADGVGPVTD